MPVTKFQDRCLKPLGHPSCDGLSSTWRGHWQEQIENWPWYQSLRDPRGGVVMGVMHGRKKGCRGAVL